LLDTTQYMIYLNKILPVFVMPIMLIIYLLIFGFGRKKGGPFILR
jgi:hypothetical protein